MSVDDTDRERADDAELLNAWRAGDTQAGNVLVSRHARTVLRFFRRKLDHGAEDLTQRTFLAAVEGRDRVTDARRFRTYILGIARHELHRVFRHKARAAPELAVPSVASPSAVARDSEDYRRLLVGLRQLPLDLQITIELHYWEEMTTAEIAAVLDVAPGTVKWRLSRAREMLAKALAQLPAMTAPATADGIDRWISSMRAVLKSDED